MKHLLIVFIFFIATAQKSNETVLAPGDFQSLSRTTSNAIILDVRRPDEVSVSRIKDSQNIVWDENFANKLSALKNHPIFVYCKGGVRSAKAAKILRDKGYSNVYELKGGLDEWISKGFPVVK